MDHIKFGDKYGGARRISDAEAALLAALQPQGPTTGGTGPVQNSDKSEVGSGVVTVTYPDTADDAAVLDEFEEASSEYQHSRANADAEQRARFKKARAAVLARMSGDKT